MPYYKTLLPSAPFVFSEYIIYSNERPADELPVRVELSNKAILEFSRPSGMVGVNVKSSLYPDAPVGGGLLFFPGFVTVDAAIDAMKPAWAAVGLEIITITPILEEASQPAPVSQPARRQPDFSDLYWCDDCGDTAAQIKGGLPYCGSCGGLLRS